MAKVRGFDFDLCRKIILRFDELASQPNTNKPTKYDFEGCKILEVEHYIRKMGEDGIFEVWLRQEYTPIEQLGRWPVAIKEKGLAFLKYAKDEDVWNEAIETMKAMGEYDTPTLLKMRRALREASERRLNG